MRQSRGQFPWVVLTPKLTGNTAGRVQRVVSPLPIDKVILPPRGLKEWASWSLNTYLSGVELFTFVSDASEEASVFLRGSAKSRARYLSDRL